MGQLEDLEFHVTDGFTAKRVDKGSVRLRKYKDSHCDDILFEITVDYASWASIVAHVSKRGETGESYHEARAFHDQEPKKEPDSDVTKS